jgi:DNA-binding response OmpR family regulator
VRELRRRREAGADGDGTDVAAIGARGALTGMGVTRARPADVLVVDDDPDVLEFTRFLLSSRGYTVRTSEDGEVALHEMRRRPPDALVLDIMMPRLDGRGVMRGMKADPTLCGVPIVVISGAADLGPELDGCAVLCKPVDPEALVAEVARCVGHGAPR